MSHSKIAEWRATLAEDSSVANCVWHDPDAPFDEFRCNNTMLHLAAACAFHYGGWRDSDDLEFAALLLEFGADPNRLNDNGITPLHYACMLESQEFDMVKLLLDKAANPNLIYNDGYTPIHYAISPHEESRHIVDLLLKHGANVDFDTAVRLGDAKRVRRFLRSADISQSRDPRRLLNHAINANSVETLELLLNAGADPNQRPKYCPESPLYIACMRGNVDVVRLLLDHGADPNPKRYKPLAAASNGFRNTKIIKMLKNALENS